MFTTVRNTLFVLFISISASVASEENLSQQIDVTRGGKLVVDVDFGTIQVIGDAMRTSFEGNCKDGLAHAARWLRT